MQGGEKESKKRKLPQTMITAFMQPGAKRLKPNVEEEVDPRLEEEKGAASMKKVDEKKGKSL